MKMYLLNVAFSFFTPHIFFRNVLKKKKRIPTYYF